MRMNYLKQIFVLVMTIISLFSFNLFAANNVHPLPPDKAFSFSATFVRPSVLSATFHIAPGYYLYKSRTHITFTPEVNAQVTFPEGTKHSDEDQGTYEIFTHDFTIPIEMDTDHQQVTLNVSYQGCSSQGFCYPPTEKNIIVNIPNLSVAGMSMLANVSQASVLSFKSLLTNQNDIRELMSHLHPSVILLIFVGLGLLLAFTPCVLPMIPILTSIIVGQKHAPGTKKAFFLSTTYVLGMSLTYAIAGVVAASLGNSVQVWLQKPITIAIVSAVFVLLALSLFGLYELRISHRWHNRIAAWSNKHEGGTYLGVFFMGILSTLVVSPCVTAPLVGVLIYIGQTGNLLFGASSLFAMGIGMGLPLLVIGMSAGKILPKSGPWMKAIKEMFGFFMVAMAIWLMSRIVSPTTTQILFGLLFLGIALFVGLYLPRLIRKRKINRTIGFLSGVLGMFLIYNAIITSTIVIADSSQNAPAFTVVHDMNQLTKELTVAQTENRPVILDFYADWCESCVEMDRAVFHLPKVKAALTNFVLLRVDLSNNTSADAEILKHYDVIAPPAVLFFNDAGLEVNSRRIVGELNVNEFMLRLDSFMTASCDKKKVQC